MFSFGGKARAQTMLAGSLAVVCEGTRCNWWPCSERQEWTLEERRVKWPCSPCSRGAAKRWSGSHDWGEGSKGRDGKRYITSSSHGCVDYLIHYGRHALYNCRWWKRVVMVSIEWMQDCIGIVRWLCLIKRFAHFMKYLCPSVWASSQP